ncbi:MAG: YdcF family protein [Clostridia bacterium]|nr:YdcF family protein [Clostridia bacterium]
MRTSATERNRKRFEKIRQIGAGKVMAGFAVLYVLTAFLIALVVVNIKPEPELEAHMISSRQMVNLGFFIGGVACFGYALLLRVKCGRLSGDRVWPVLGFILVLRAVAVGKCYRVFGMTSMDEELYTVLHAVCLAVLGLQMLLQTLILVNSFRACPRGMDALIVHGAKSGSRVLLARADAAAGYLEKNPAALAVASGGRGADETESEAKSIADRMIAEGIDAGRILLEEASRTTHENLEKSAVLLPAECERVAVVTDDYHVFRARCMALGVLKRPVFGLPVHSSYISLPHYVFREYLSALVHFIKGDLFR